MSDLPVIGPSLPPHLTARDEKESDESIVAQSLVGPQLPPTRESNTPPSKASYGPCLPPGMMYGPPIPEKETNDESVLSDESVPSDESEDEDDIIGPKLPIGDTSGDSLTTKKREIEARAQAMKNKLTKPDDGQPQRESWMTELPSKEIKIGLGPRKFRSTYAELGDRSVWTDTPADKERKAATAAATAAATGMTGKNNKRAKVRKEPVEVSERDKELARQVEEYNKKYRSETLTEISRKRQKEISDAPKEKKMFNPETDLQLPKIMSQSKKKEVIKKSSKDLQSKFTHGSQGHFL
ncbi:GPALPP motifs-containing protein 1-like isoform X2 [Dysidea avara]|uniref:GPALPP motifs-containing protein 1-like isoform X2 n=1 Tax=Dysidea avara TaxID=196820 RepID=UPI00331ECD3D